MTLTQTDLSAIGNLIDQKLDQKLKQELEPIKTDLANVGSLIDQKLEPIKTDLANVGSLIDQKLKQNNRVLEKKIAQQMADALAENNKIIIDNLETFIEAKSDTKSIKQQLARHAHRLDKIESQLSY